MFPSATAVKWHQTRLKQQESLEKKGTICEWLKADLPIGVIVTAIPWGRKLPILAFLIPQFMARDKNPDPFRNTNVGNFPAWVQLYPLSWPWCLCL